MSDAAPPPTPSTTARRSPSGYRGGRGQKFRRTTNGPTSRAPQTVDVFSEIPDYERAYTSYGDEGASNGGDFRVVSFNVLADYLATSPDGNLAHSHPSQAWKFQWPFRCTRLLREILTWQGAIVCLQEVDHFEDFFEPELAKYGYIGHHKRRTGADTHDGCSIFVKEDLFDVVQVKEFEYHVPGHQILNRDNVALVLVLKHKATNEEIVVANTHILFNPRRGDVKLAQIQMLFDFVQTLPSTKLIICGDFNLTPKSALYEFISRGHLEGSEVPIGDASGQFARGHSSFHNQVHKDEVERHQGGGTAAYRYGSENSRPRRQHYNQDNLGEAADHQLPLRSAYAQHPTNETTGEPFATSYHDRFLGTVDYIWYADLECTGVVEMPGTDFFHGIRALPTRDLSSDHLSLVADFAFRSNN